MRRMLRDLDATEKVGAAIELLERGDVAGAAERAVLRLLPRLDHLEVLNRRQVNVMGRVLSDGRPALSVVLLRALAVVGDRATLKPVRRLLATTQDTEVRTAAERCAAAIASRISLESARASLLRPVPSAGGAVASLLRPAGNGSCEDAQEAELLRSVDRTELLPPRDQTEPGG
jgi:hypothetical protein